MKYHVIIENGETRYLRTKADIMVVGLMLNEYLKIEDKTEWSFAKYLFKHGIDCVYDGTFGYFDIDEMSASKSI